MGLLDDYGPFDRKRPLMPPGTEGMGPRQKMEARIRQLATERGLDPDRWSKIVEGESRWDPAARTVTGKEDSRGLLQLNVKGGLGTEALKSGVSLAPEAWEQQAAFGMDHAAKRGDHAWTIARQLDGRPTPGVPINPVVRAPSPPIAPRFTDPSAGAIQDTRSGGTPSWGTGSPGFPPTKMDWKPAVAAPQPGIDAPKLQERLGPPPAAVAADVADTFSPTPMTGMNPITPPQPFDASRFADVPGPAPTRVAAPAFPPSRPAGIDAPTRTAAVPTPPSRPASLGILSPTPLSPQRPTGVPTVTPPPSLVENAPQPPPRPAGLGDPAPAPTPPAAPTPPPIIPTAAIGSPTADFGGGDIGQGLGGGLGNGSDDIGQGLGGSLGNGSDDLAFAGGGDAGGVTADAGGGGGGGLGGILGAIGGLAKGLGGGGGGGASAPAPPVPVAKAPQLAPMTGDPGMARRAQGAQQVMSGLLADPSLIDPRKKQAGLLA